MSRGCLAVLIALVCAAPTGLVRAQTPDLGTEAQTQATGQMIEAEPNDTPEQAQSLALVPNNDIRSYEITGTSDDIEYFDNGKVGALVLGRGELLEIRRPKS